MAKNPSQSPTTPSLIDLGQTVIADVLKASQPRPNRSDPVGTKNQYAVRFADHMGTRIAADLFERLEDITATTKRTASSARGKKQLDVNFSTPRLGLALGISLKSVHLRDVKGAERYTHNMKRNEEELRIEASGYHKRQPYAVMVAVLFLPFDSTEDGKKDNPSSFGSWVRHLRPYAGRRDPEDDIDKFEKIYIGLYEPNGDDLRFFDVETAPPKNGRPKQVLSYREFLNEVYHVYLQRNEAEFRWAEGDDEPLDLERDLDEEDNEEA
ncbi:MAG: hypothetical protein AB7I50_01335 [Vicinamibacterales bacterium]